MFNKDRLKIIDFWQKVALEEDLFQRNITKLIDTKSKEIVDVTGPRRSGKSSLLKLILRKLNPKDGFLYLNFEDPYFIEHNDPEIILEMVDTFKEYFQPGLKYLFFDEIQNIKSWEKAIRKLRDTNSYKIFISGSSSKLLGGEFASLLSGRHLSYTLLPLSFSEFLIFKKIEVDSKKDLIIKEKTVLRLFDEYLEKGGFPAVVLSKRPELLKQYYLDIVQKDIISRYDIREKSVMEKMGVFLLSNSAKILSLLSIQKLYDISYELVSAYFSYFKEAFLVFELPQYSHSLKTQQKALKKIYPVDVGLANATSFRFSKEKGRMLESVVFLELIRSGKEVFYYKTSNNKEVDFLIKTEGTYELIQVCWDLDDPKTKKREIQSLNQAMSETKVKKSLILTYNYEDKIEVDQGIIGVLPVYKWLLKYG